MRKKVIAGLIGAGRIGKMHAENIISRFPDVYLKTVADIKLDESWAAKLGIEVRASDKHEIIDDPEIKAVIIATPSSTHVDIICAAAEAGKHIFCEKPVAFNPDNILKAIAAVDNAGVLFQVGFNRRFDPDFSHVHKIVKRGDIGNPHIFKITNRDPFRPDMDYIPDSGGLFMDFCVHDFDTLRFLSGSEVKEIYVAGAVLVDPEIEKLGDIDTALITLKMADGSLGIIDVCRETNYGYDQQIEVFGTKGSIRACNTTPTRTVLSTSEGVFTDNPYYSFVERYQEAYIAELRAFFSCVRTKNQPSVGGEDALAAVKIAISAQQSLNRNKPIRVT